MGFRVLINNVNVTAETATGWVAVESQFGLVLQVKWTGLDQADATTTIYVSQTGTDDMADSFAVIAMTGGTGISTNNILGNYRFVKVVVAKGTCTAGTSKVVV